MGPLSLLSNDFHGISKVEMREGSKQTVYLPTHLPKGSKQTFIFTYLPKWNLGDKQIIFGLWDLHMW